MAWLRLLNKNSLLKGSGGTGGQWIDRSLIQVNSDGGEAWLIQLKTNSLNFTLMAKEPNLFCRGSLLCYFVQRYCVGGGGVWCFTTKNSYMHYPISFPAQPWGSSPTWQPEKLRFKKMIGSSNPDHIVDELIFSVLFCSGRRMFCFNYVSVEAKISWW